MGFGFSMGKIKPAPKKAVRTIDTTASEKVFGGGKTARDEQDEIEGPPRKKTFVVNIDLSDSYSGWKSMMERGGQAQKREEAPESNDAGENAAPKDPAEVEAEEARVKEFADRAKKGWRAPCTMPIEELPDADTDVEIEDVGSAIMRGLGWKDGEALGGKRKGLKESIAPKQRPGRLGVGAAPPPVPVAAKTEGPTQLPHHRNIKRNAGPAPLSHT